MDWIEDATSWIEAAATWVEGIAETVGGAIRGGLLVRKKRLGSFVPHIETDREFVARLAAEAMAREVSEEERNRQVAAENAEWERREHFRELAKAGAQKRRIQRIVTEQKRLERNTNLAMGRQVRKQHIQERASARPKSPVAEIVERKRENKEKMARLRRTKKYKQRCPPGDLR